MGTEIANHNQRVRALEGTIRDKLTHRVAEVLPKAIGTSPERFLATVFTVLAGNPKLAECTPASIMTGILRGAQSGLELDGVQAALVPYKGVATFVPMYQGYIRAMYRSGVVAGIQVPRLVYKGDTFEYEYGLHEKLRHVPKLEADNQTDENILAGYCIVTLTSGERIWEITPRRVFDATKARAKTQNVWNSDFGPMCMKTTVRRVAKFVSQRAEQAELSRMIARDERLDAGIADTPLDFDSKPGQVQLDSLDDLFGGDDPEGSPELPEDKDGPIDF
jgi:recombination protein RecT